MDLGFLLKYYKFYISGTGVTIFLSFFGVILGTILGVLLALMKLSKFKIGKIEIISKLASIYIEIVRGTPLYVQLLIVYFGLPIMTGLEVPDILAGIIAVSLNSAAYVAEIIRAGILSIDKGQMEAARSLGMNHKMAMKYIIIPQAFKNILPALGNEFVVLIKESAIVAVVGINDLMRNTEIIRGNSYKPFAPLIPAAIIYFIITFSISRLLAKVEKGLRAGDSHI